MAGEGQGGGARAGAASEVHRLCVHQSQQSKCENIKAISLRNMKYGPAIVAAPQSPLLPACLAPTPISLTLAFPFPFSKFLPLSLSPCVLELVCQSCSKSIFVSSLLTSSICVLNLETDAQQKQDKGQGRGGEVQRGKLLLKASHEQEQSRSRSRSHL